MLTLQTSIELFATLACAIFAGAALYVNLVEHPAMAALTAKFYSIISAILAMSAACLLPI